MAHKQGVFSSISDGHSMADRDVESLKERIKYETEVLKATLLIAVATIGGTIACSWARRLSFAPPWRLLVFWLVSFQCLASGDRIELYVYSSSGLGRCNHDRLRMVCPRWWDSHHSQFSCTGLENDESLAEPGSFVTARPQVAHQRGRNGRSLRVGHARAGGPSGAWGTGL